MPKMTSQNFWSKWFTKYWPWPVIFFLKALKINIFLNSKCNPSVLGDYFRRAWHRPHRHVPRRLRPAVGADQRVLQRGERRQVRAQGRPGRPGAWNDGLGEVWTIRADFPTWQLCLRAIWGRQQLGQGPLHGGSRAGGQRAGRGEEGGGVLRLSSGLPVDPLLGRRHWVRHGNVTHLQDQRRVPWQDHEHLQRRAQSQGVRHSGGALQRHPLRAPTCREHRRNLLHWQRGLVRHLFPDFEVDHPDLWRPQPPCFPHNVRRHHLP